MAPSLAEQVDGFVATLNSVLRPALGDEVTFEATLSAGQYRIGPAPFVERGYSRLPMRRPADRADRAALLELSVQYRCGLDPEKEHLAVQSSTFGLWVRTGPKGAKASPVVRIEYDRHPRSKAAAHVHFHAESTAIGWLYGAAGRGVPQMQELHFPLGDRRFRPCIEDFLEFIDTEKLFRDWADPGRFKQRLKETRADWEYRQARATARRHRDAVIDQLRAEGYTITKAEGDSGPAQSLGK